MISNAIEKAQSKVEERNFDIRKHLLDYDDVLNEQRNFIYNQRDNILADEELDKRVLAAAKEIVDDIVDQALSSGKDPKLMVKQIQEMCNDNFRIVPEIDELAISSKNRENLVLDIMKPIELELMQKIEKIGKKQFNAFLRYQYLKHIDTKWQDHLETLEALREAVYLRSYAQKNPLLEYKLEGFDIFDNMLLDIKANIARTAIRIQITENAPKNYRNQRQITSELHKGVLQFAAQASGANSSQQGAAPQQVQIKRSVPKVGRNDPCPCGSGKKYKYCHGAK